MTARRAGVTFNEIVSASKDGLTDAVIIQAMNCQHLHHTKWAAIGAALEQLGY